MNHWKMSPPGRGLSRGFTVLTIGALEHPWPAHRRFLFFFFKIDEHASEAWERGRNARKKKNYFFFSPPPTPNLKMGNASLRCWRFVWREGKTRSEMRANSAVVVAFASFSPLFFLPSAINACKALFNLTCYHPSGQGTSPALRTRWWVIFGTVLSQQLGLGNSEKTLTRGWHKGGGPQDCLFSRKNARIRRKVVGQE